ncbi:MAG: hypothetical protein IBX69_04595 [Anaerolineales bacterium]|nr:hypothetical protein [Anaerolineales bacterium]
MRVYRSIPTLSIFLVILFLTSCSTRNDQTSTPSTPSQDVDLTSLPPPAETVVPQITDTASPQISPPAASAQVVLIATDPDADPDLFESTSDALENLASVDGLSFEVRSAMEVEQLHDGLRLVAALPPDPGLVDLANHAPQIHFLAIGIPGLQPASNLSLIPAEDQIVAKVSFLAGYIAAVVTPDWRVGVLASERAPSELVARQSFQNGVIFFCGLCQLSHPPYHSYPIYALTDSEPGEAGWKSAADDLIGRAVRTVYVTPGAADEALLAYLAGEGVQIIGHNSPPDEIRDHWIASVRVDYTQMLSNSWLELLSGESGYLIPQLIMISNVNQELFSPGRQMLVDALLPDLMSGYIDTGISSESGQEE